MPKKPSVPSARGAKVIDSRGRGGVGAPGVKKGVPGNARKSAPGREKVFRISHGVAGLSHASLISL